MWSSRWPVERRPECVEQVANAPDSSIDLTPVSDVPAQEIRDGWHPLESGQEVPLIWERVTPDDEPCDSL